MDYFMETHPCVNRTRSRVSDAIDALAGAFPDDIDPILLRSNAKVELLRRAIATWPSVGSAGLCITPTRIERYQALEDKSGDRDFTGAQRDPNVTYLMVIMLLVSLQNRLDRIMSIIYPLATTQDMDAIHGAGYESKMVPFLMAADSAGISTPAAWKHFVQRASRCVNNISHHASLLAAEAKIDEKGKVINYGLMRFNDRVAMIDTVYERGYVCVESGPIRMVNQTAHKITDYDISQAYLKEA